METKRILIVISTLSGGGAERIASILGTELYEREYEVHFLTFYDSAEYDFKGEYTTLNEEFKRSVFSKGIKLIKRAYNIAKYCENNSIDTVVSFMEEANFPAIISKMFGNKSRMIVSQRINPKKQSKSYGFLIKRLYPFAYKCVSLSKGVEISLKKEFKLSNTKTIYNMEEIEKNLKQSKKKLSKQYGGIFRDNFNFITIGRLSKQKGQWHLIRAFKKVNEEEPNSNLLILGKGKLEKNLKNLTKKLNLENNILFLGFQDNVFSFLKESDCFVLSSLYEGFGNVIIEALSLNLPVISTDCNFGPREILAPELGIGESIEYPYYGKYGILTKTPSQEDVFQNLKQERLNKEETLVDAMIGIMNNQKLRKKYLNGLERAKDFNTKNIVGEWEKIL